MRDLLAEETREEKRLAAQISREFFLFGYEEVRLPAFEYLDVISRGLGKIDPELLVRFVEPETGEVVALRPDMTPQVARLVASRWPEAPNPLRLSYHGSVMRRSAARARNNLQVLQAGIELVGASGSAADFEVISACLAALTAVGLREFVLDLGHGGLAAALLNDFDESTKKTLLHALSQKDQVEVQKALQGQTVAPSLAEAILAFPELQGGPEVLARALSMPGFQGARAELEALGQVVERAQAAGLGPKLVIDLGETSSTPYYTGVMFQVLAEGPGQAVASGGRYDELYSRFGIERTAAGGGINIDHLRWALGTEPHRAVSRILVVPGSPAPTDAEVAGTLSVLRRAGRAAAYLSEQPIRGEQFAYAQGANFSHILELRASKQLSFWRVTADGVDELSAIDLEDVLALVPGTV